MSIQELVNRAQALQLGPDLQAASQQQLIERIVTLTDMMADLARELEVIILREKEPK